MRRAALVLVAALASPALADEPRSNADLARERFERGQKLYNLGKFREAIADFEAAYQLDPDAGPAAAGAYLFNLAQAYRLDVPKDIETRIANIDRALFFYRRFLELAGDDAHRAEVEGRIQALEQERVAGLATKAAADKAAADKAAADKAAADKAPRPKHLRLAVDVGASILYLVGDSDARQSPQLSGRILVAYMRTYGHYTVDLGGSWQLTTLPYRAERTDGTDEAASAFYTQLHAVAAVMRPIAGPIWGRVGIGLGLASFGNLKKGNPIATNMDPSSDVRMLCARIDTVAGYRYNPTIDFVLGVTSASTSARSKELDARLARITTLEGFYLGLYLKL